MKYIIIAILFTISLISKGVEAGSVIVNIANISYTINSMKYHIQSNMDSFVVDKIIDIKSSWQDSSAIEVSSNEKDRVLTFLISNLGNSDENVSLEKFQESNSTFELTNIRVYEDINSNGIFDSNDSLVDRIYLKHDESKRVFIVSDIEDVNGTYSYASIVGVVNEVANSGSDRKDSVDIVIRSAKTKSTGTYKLRDYYLVVNKSAKVLSADSKLHTGSIIEYEIDVKIEGGKGRFKDVVVSDNIPQKTTYILHSLKLDSTWLSDANDSDQGYFDGDKIVVKIGDISNFNNTQKEHKISFKVKLN